MNDIDIFNIKISEHAKERFIERFQKMIGKTLSSDTYDYYLKAYLSNAHLIAYNGVREKYSKYYKYGPFIWVIRNNVLVTVILKEGSVYKYKKEFKKIYKFINNILKFKSRCKKYRKTEPAFKSSIYIYIKTNGVPISKLCARCNIGTTKFLNSLDELNDEEVLRMFKTKVACRCNAVNIPIEAISEIEVVDVNNRQERVVINMGDYIY